MICVETSKRYCRDDLSKIENYREAMESTEMYECHHRLEITLDGEFTHTADDLKRLGMYYRRPAFELIFVRHDVHRKMHPCTPLTRARMSRSNMGKVVSPETRRRMSIAQSNRSMEHRAKISANNRLRKLSPETKVKIGAATRARYARLGGF